MKKARLKVFAALILICLLIAAGSALVFAATLVHGPYIVDMSDTAVTIMWYTNVNSTSVVEYGTGGNYSNSVTASDKGFVNVGKRHVVRITGLTPGATYNYRIKSTAVINFVPKQVQFGDTFISNGYTFKTFDSNKPKTTFYYTANIKDDTNTYQSILNLINTNGLDFVAFGGNQFESVENESQVFSSLIDPAVEKFAKSIPMVYARGNLDMRGVFARNLKSFIPHSSGKYYYGFNDGPAAFVVLDTAEDSSDDTPWMGGLIKAEPYREEEYNWLQEYTNSSEFLNQPVKIFIQSDPNFGYVDESKWIETANNAEIDLLLSASEGAYSHIEPGTGGRNYHQLIVGQGQFAQISAAVDKIDITVYDSTGAEVDSLTILTGEQGQGIQSETMLGDITTTGGGSVWQSVELGTIFQASVPGKITAVRIYGYNDGTYIESGEHIVRIWDNTTNEVIAGPYTFDFVGSSRWETFELPVPVSIAPDTQYIVSISTGTDEYKFYSAIEGYFNSAGGNGKHLSWPANAGVVTTEMGAKPDTAYNYCFMRDVVFVPDEQ
jgi:hypothetical protein